ncbi:MAG: hypothetical protein K0S71_377 [Clostridia bacterium]|jgi:hypothetical protein|nr:hypothetical protein [Clostridia bacterium]
MLKKELVHIICAAVLNESFIKKQTMETSNFCGRNTSYKRGIYFLFDDKDNVIYVGMVGNSANTSLYDRMVGHGKGSHKNKDARWYDKVAKGKFHIFSQLSNNELRKVERLAIWGMGQPQYNDIDITNNDISSLLKKL